MKNEFIIDGDKVLITVRGSKEPAIIDKEDFDKVYSVCGTLRVMGMGDPNYKYVGFRRKDDSGSNRAYYLHRIVMDVVGKSGLKVNIRNGNYLDCRKKNLYLSGNYSGLHNNYTVLEDTVEIDICSVHGPVIIDKEDFDRVRGVCGPIHAQTSGRRIYGMLCPTHSERSYLHRFIMGVTDPSVRVYFIDGDTMNCRKENLRTVFIKRREQCANS